MTDKRYELGEGIHLRKVIICAGIIGVFIVLISGNFLVKKVWSSNNDDAQFIASYVEEHKDEKIVHYL